MKGVVRLDDMAYAFTVLRYNNLIRAPVSLRAVPREHTPGRIVVCSDAWGR